jgi:hypothetical protein
MQRRPRRTKHGSNNKDRYGHGEHGRGQRTQEKHHGRDESDGKLEAGLKGLRDEMKAPLNRNDSYVQRWLEGTSAEGMTTSYVPKQEASGYNAG